MGKGRACSDPFSLNSYIDVEKVLYLYQPSITECAPNDPFNDWTVVYDNGEIKQLFFDIVDTIGNEEYELEIIDQLIDYDGNFIYDTWETFRILSDYVDTLTESFEFAIVDSNGDLTLTDEWITEIVNVEVDIIDSDNYILTLTDNNGNEFTLTDIDVVQEVSIDRIFDSINNEFYDTVIYDEDGILITDMDQLFENYFIDSFGVDIEDSFVD